VKGPLRSTLAALLAALALACAGFGVRGGAEDAAESRRPVLRAEHAGQGMGAKQTPAPVFQRGGTLVLDGPPRRTGPLPRLTPAKDPSQGGSFAARTVVREATGTRIRRILTLALARHLAAARDGTLSSRSTGLPPPSPA